MAVFDLIGVPIPKNAPVFSDDDKLLRKIKRVEGLIELKNDINDAKEAMMPLKNALEKDENEIHQLLGGAPFQLPDIILSYIIVLYSKAFTSSTGRLNLNGEVDNIFKENIRHHEFLMSLRHKFYAHQEIHANSHQLFCFPNTPDKKSVAMNPNGQTIRVKMASSVNLNSIELSINCLLMYLEKHILELCRVIENTLTDEQVKVINETPKMKLLNEHWDENAKNRKNAFQSRKPNK